MPVRPAKILRLISRLVSWRENNRSMNAYNFRLNCTTNKIARLIYSFVCFADTSHHAVSSYYPGTFPMVWIRFIHNIPTLRFSTFPYTWGTQSSNIITQFQDIPAALIVRNPKFSDSLRADFSPSSGCFTTRFLYGNV